MYWVCSDGILCRLSGKIVSASSCFEAVFKYKIDFSWTKVEAKCSIPASLLLRLVEDRIDINHFSALITNKSMILINNHHMLSSNNTTETGCVSEYLQKSGSIQITFLPPSLTRSNEGGGPFLYIKVTGTLETLIHAHPLEPLSNVIELLKTDLISSLDRRLKLLVSRLQSSKLKDLIQSSSASSSSEIPIFEIELPRRGWLSDPLVESSIFSALSASSSSSPSSNKNTKKSSTSVVYPLHRTDIPFLSCYSFKGESYEELSLTISKWLSIPETDFSIRFNEDHHHSVHSLSSLLSVDHVGGSDSRATYFFSFKTTVIALLTALLSILLYNLSSSNDL